MRIGFDMLAVQSPHHGARGIGRYSSQLVATLLNRDDDHEYVLYLHDELPADRVPRSPRAAYRTVRPRWEQGETMVPCVDRLARTNPDGLDALVVLSPFERWALYAPPARPDEGPKVVSVVYDLIPFLFQNEAVVDPELQRHYRTLETLARHDALLCISESSRRDCLAMLRIDPGRVVNIGGASDPAFFTPGRDVVARLGLRSLGVTKPYVFNVGGLDPRKNLWTLFEAFAALPRPVREAHQLVVTFMTDDWGRAHVIENARRFGIEDALVVTGEVSDETLRDLYRNCAAFAFPSLYEGFGLPLLEAMHCGAAVLGGNNSSQVEVVGDAGLLANANDAHEVAAGLARLLTDRPLARSLGARAVDHARRFSWERTAGRALEEIEGLARRRRPSLRVRFDRGHARKPVVALFSPLPPRKSGISDYSAFLLDELRKTYRVDLFHDTGYVPTPALASDEFMAADYRLFDRLSAARDYRAVVYQMGNSRYHSYMYPTMLRHPGVMVLHDFCLAGFHLHYGHSRGMGMGFIAGELRRWYPEERAAVEHALATWPRSWDEVSRDCAARGWYLNRGVLDAAALTVVHSPWCKEAIRRGSPRYADDVLVIPHGIHPCRSDPASRAAVRARFKIDPEALVVASFGFVHPDKMSPQALDAFAEVAREDGSALFLFAGEEADGGEVRAHAAGLGLSDRVRFLGRQPHDDFLALMTAVDVGVNLRMPPTNGETSGALLHLLAAGVPTVVTDVATFSDYPSTVVRKVRWESEGPAGLLRALRGLAGDRAARAALGRAAWAHVEAYHEWSRVAGLYVEAIERCHEAQARAARSARARGTVFPEALGRALASA